MKILHTADIHLGVKNTRLSKDKQMLLKDEAIYNIRAFFDLAKQSKYDVILICGDLFHAKAIASKYSKTFFDAIERFEMPVIYVSGNHDENFIFPEILPKNFIMLDKCTPVFRYENFNFYNQFFDENIAINKNENNILLLHGNIENSKDADYINIDKYLNKGFDYIALGHVHQFKKYKVGNNLFAYSGCLFSNGFDESGQKGYIKIEFEDKKNIQIEFVPFPARKFVVCESDISNLTTNREIIDKIENDLEEHDANFQDLVRVVLKGSIGEICEKSIPFILSKFSNYFYIEINDKTTFKIDIEKIKTEKLSFKYEFISLVEQSELDDESKRLVCEIGLEALKGEDLNI